MKSLIPSAVVLALGSLAMGCASPPVITKEIYQDRSMWIRLEKNPYGDKTPGVVRTEEETSITSGALAVWLKGFRVLTERGIIGMASGKAATDMAFVEPEILALAPHLAKGLALAKPDERVAYCFVADRNLEERYITTAFLYAQKPYLYYKLEEYRTLVKVHMSASTSQACQTKPQPGYKTADRYFRLEYSPEEFVVGYGLPEKFGSFMAGIGIGCHSDLIAESLEKLPQGVSQAPIGGDEQDAFPTGHHVRPPPVGDSSSLAGGI